MAIDLMGLSLAVARPEFDGQTSEQKAASLMVKASITGTANALEAKAYLLKQGRWPAIRRVGYDAAEPAAVREACLAFIEAESLEEIDTNSPAAIAAMDGLIAANMLDALQKTALMAMGTKEQSEAETLGHSGDEALLVQYIDKVEAW